MIVLILKNYVVLFFSIGLISIVLFIVGLFWIIRNTFFLTKQRNKTSSHDHHNPIFYEINSVHTRTTSQSFENFLAIAGGDVYVTQLDLARAYIEANKKNLAQELLQQVLLKGNETQQQEAKALIQLIQQKEK